MSKRVNVNHKRAAGDPYQGSAAPSPVASRTASPLDPAPEEIARLAYSYWQERGCPQGSAEEDWLHAEAELRGRALSASAA